MYTIKKLLFLLFLFIATNVFAQQVDFTFYFDSGESKVAGMEMYNFFKFIQGKKVDSITLYGRCDSIGDVLYNQQLSEARIAAVIKQLTTNGIKKKNIKIWKGYGELAPIDSNSTYMGRLHNRSVQVFVNEIVLPPKPAKPVKPKKVKVIKPVEEIAIVPEIKDEVINIEKPILVKKKIKAGTKLKIKQIFFQEGTHLLIDGEEEKIDVLLNFLNTRKEIKIKITGHICCMLHKEQDGEDKLTGTYDLSVQRAKMIYTLLVENGIDPNRLEYEGKAALESIYPNEQTPEEASANRRVEFLVIE